jgi:hypothetical protein
MSERRTNSYSCAMGHRWNNEWGKFTDNQKNALAFLVWCGWGDVCLLQGWQADHMRSGGELSNTQQYGAARWERCTQRDIGGLPCRNSADINSDSLYICASVTGLSSQFTGNTKIDIQFSTTSSLPGYVDSCSVFVHGGRSSCFQINVL